MKVLLVEDNELNSDMLARRLQRHGCDVVLAVDGETALTEAERGQPDIILMDISLPICDGLEVTRRLKANPVTRAHPGDCVDRSRVRRGSRSRAGRRVRRLPDQADRLSAAARRARTVPKELTWATAPALRLLLTDDEELNRDMLSRRLARHGYDVLAVAERAGDARRHRARGLRRAAPRRHDAGDERPRGAAPSAPDPHARAVADHHGHRARAERGHRRGARHGCERLCDQAGRHGGDAGAHPRADCPPARRSVAAREPRTPRPRGQAGQGGRRAHRPAEPRECSPTAWSG